MKTDNDKYVPSVMAYFSCDKEMAKIILKSSEKNGEIESIKRMCTVNNGGNNHGK